MQEETVLYILLTFLFGCITAYERCYYANKYSTGISSFEKAFKFFLCSISTLIIALIFYLHFEDQIERKIVLILLDTSGILVSTILGVVSSTTIFYILETVQDCYETFNPRN